LKISYTESRRVGDRVYIYAVHYVGYSKVDNKVRKRVRKCYLGPEVYEYVSRLHVREGLELRGLRDSGGA